MARTKGSKNRRTTTAKSVILDAIPSVNGRSGGYNLRSFTNMPATRYLAGGIALYGIYRLAMKLNDSYPQIGEFFSENMGSVEGKFREWTGRESVDSSVTEARH